MVSEKVELKYQNSVDNRKNTPSTAVQQQSISKDTDISRTFNPVDNDNS